VLCDLCGENTRYKRHANGAEKSPEKRGGHDLKKARDTAGQNPAKTDQFPQKTAKKC